MRGTGAVAYGAIVAMLSLLATVTPPVAGTTSAEVLKDERTSLSVSGGTLHGSLLVPPGSAPVPIALLISGSGPTDRDGNTPLLPGKNDSLKLLAEGLAARNLASLRYDKRGIGESVGAGRNESRLRFENYIDDAAAWGQRLRKDKRFSSLVIVGHSEGSLIGAVAAQKIPADAFISLEGIGQPAPDLMLAQLRPKLSPNTMAAVEGLVAKLKAGQTGMVPTGLEALFRPGVQPYLISWFKYDPVRQVSKLRMPVLIMQGTTDMQTALADATRLGSANPKARVVILDGMNHVLKRVPLDEERQVASYSDPSLPVEPRLIQEVADFVLSLGRAVQ